MKRLLYCSLYACLLVSSVHSARAQSEADRFREILQLAEVDLATLETLPTAGPLQPPEWRAVAAVMRRLDQFRQLQPADSAAEATIGELQSVTGRVVAFEKLSPPESLNARKQEQDLYRCELQLEEPFSPLGDATSLTLFAPRVPKAWRAIQQLSEPTQIRAVLARLGNAKAPPVFITDWVSWYPDKHASAGQLLLAAAGMDVALLDEVVHGQPFVEPSVSREGEAFYGTLLAMRWIQPDTLRRESKEEVRRVAEAWAAKEPRLREEQLHLQAKLKAGADQSEQAALEIQLRRAQNEIALATTVAKQAKQGQSSVAPMFLQPQHEVGQLYTFAGTARRAVWIAAESLPAPGGYFEVEVYPSESRLLDNRPVVCCVNDLPVGFPRGDAIREPVQVAGVFFKSWRYRARELRGGAGETARQRSLYTPVLVGSTPIWLDAGPAANQPLVFWAGILFLVALAAIWIGLSWRARRDRLARLRNDPREQIEIPH